MSSTSNCLYGITSLLRQYFVTIEILLSQNWVIIASECRHYCLSKLDWTCRKMFIRQILFLTNSVIDKAKFGGGKCDMFGLLQCQIISCQFFPNRESPYRKWLSSKIDYAPITLFVIAIPIVSVEMGPKFNQKCDKIYLNVTIKFSKM